MAELYDSALAAGPLSGGWQAEGVLAAAALAWLPLLGLVLARVGGLVLAAPLVGHAAVPVRFRLALALGVALLVAPAQFGRSPLPVGAAEYAVACGGELLVGLVLGMGIRLLLVAALVAGGLIGQLAGWSATAAFDPATGGAAGPLGRLLYLVALAAFVLMGGHRLLITALLETYSSLPPGSGGVSASLGGTLAALLGHSFQLGLQAAAPALVALLLTTLALGLASRTVPQLNLVSVGFGLNSLVGLGALFCSLGGVAWLLADQVEPALELLVESLARR